MTKVHSSVIFFFNKKFICEVGIANMIMKPSNTRKDTANAPLWVGWFFFFFGVKSIRNIE